MGLAVISRNFACMKCNKVNLKRIIPALQVRERSTSKDEKSKDLKLIYNGLLNKKIFYVKFISLSTSIIGLCALPMIFTKAMESSSAVVCAATLMMMGIFTFGSPLLLHFISRSYALHIYHNEKKDNYVVETYTFLLKKNQLEFTPADVVLPTIDRMFSSVHIKKHPIFMDCKNFTDTKYYYIIMGYDKPFDLKLDDEGEETVAVGTDKVKNSNDKQ